MRLSDMGVEPFLVASTVEGVMAQRLVRRLCPDCSKPYRPDPVELPDDFPVESWLANDGWLYRPEGCESCRGTGYRGRMGIYELLVTNDEIRELANQRTASTEIKRAAIRSGMSTLRGDGWMKAIDGVTTIDEVLRVTKAD